MSRRGAKSCHFQKILEIFWSEKVEIQVCEQKISIWRCTCCGLEEAELARVKTLPALSTSHAGALEQGAGTIFLRG